MLNQPVALDGLDAVILDFGGVLYDIDYDAQPWLRGVTLDGGAVVTVPMMCCCDYGTDESRLSLCQNVAPDSSSTCSSQSLTGPSMSTPESVTMPNAALVWV